MDLRQLECFHTIADTGSLSKASERLNYAQSNLSTIIRKLEQEVDAQLFFRTPQGMVLTAKGKELYFYAEKMLSISDKISRTISSEEAGSNIRIGSLESIAVTILPEILSAFRETHPQDNVHVGLGPSFGRNGLVERVLGYDCDLAFVSGEIDDPELEQRVIGEDHVVIVSTKDYGSDFTFHDILENQILSFPYGCTCRILYDRFAESIGVKPMQILETESLSTIFSNVVAGMGVACFPKSCVNFYERSFRVFSYDLPDPYSHMDWSIIYRKDTYLSRSMKRLIGQVTSGKRYVDGNVIVG